MGLNRSSIIAATLLLALGLISGCDDESKEQPADAGGADGSAQADTSGASEDTTVTDKKKATADPQPARPKATSPSRATVSAEAPLDVSEYLVESDLSKLVKGKVSTEPLVGTEPSPDYNAIRLHPGKGNVYGAGLQLWKLDNAKAARARLDKLRAQYLGVDNAPASAPVRGKRAFVSERAGIRSYVFATRKPAHLIAVSCDQETCKNWKDVMGLAKKVQIRLSKDQSAKK